MTGRWLLLSIFCLGTALPALGGAKESERQSVSLREAQLAAEQQKAFALSAAPRLMPESSWFQGDTEDANHPDPMQRRWIRADIKKAKISK